jgi:hypothetical protein
MVSIEGIASNNLTGKKSGPVVYAEGGSILYTIDTRKE